MTQVTEYQGGRLPMKSTPRSSGVSALSSGMTIPFAVLSIRGGKFHVKQGKEETTLVDQRGSGITNLQVVIVDANPQISRTYYAGGYSAAGGPPTCASINGDRPDAGVAEPQSQSCRSCPRAVRDKITPNGSKVSACQNHRRLAVVPVSDLANEALGGPMLVRVPGASLISLTNYDSGLARRNFDFWEVVTTLSFDPSVEYPKLVFTAERALRDGEQDIVDDLRVSASTMAVIATSQTAERAAAPAPAPQEDGFGALPMRAARRPDPREATQAPQRTEDRVENRVTAVVTPEVTPEAKPKRTRAKPTIAAAVSEPVVVEPTAAGFEASLNARLKNLI